MSFMTTTEKLNATPEELARYQDILEAEIALVKRLRVKLEPNDRVQIMGILHTASVPKLVSTLKNAVRITTLDDARELLESIRSGKKPVVTLQVPLNHYIIIKRHPLAELFIIRPAR